MKNKYLLIFFVVFLTSYSLGIAQSACLNANFSLGNFTNWIGRTGTCCPINTPTVGIVPGRHTIMTPGTDPVTGNQLQLVPPGYNFSARLGNNGTGAQGEALRYSFLVSPANALFIYNYAVVLEDPGHTPAQQPRFELRVMDAGGNTIPCTFYQVAAAGSIPGFQNFGAVRWKNWTQVGVDLSSYTGQIVTIEARSGDCSLGGHFGYGYLVGDCRPLEIVVQYCLGDTSALLIAPSGFQSYQWSDGVGIVGTDDTLVIYNPVPGQQNYSCTITSVTGCSATLTTLINPIIPLPGFLSDYVCNNTLNFTDTTLVYQDIINSWNWDFGDGNQSTAQNPSHTFPDSGWYNVSLHVQTAVGCVDDVVIPVYVEANPKADFSVPDSCSFTRVFTDLSNVFSGNNLTNWNWNFGDASTSNMQNPTHTYPSNGSYTVTLTVTDDEGCTSSISHPVVINPPPVAGITGTAAICAGQNTTLTATGGGSYLWNTGATTAAINVGPASTTTYTVTVTDAYGCTATASYTLVINPNPTATITVNNNVSCFGLTDGSLTANPSGGSPGYTYLWNNGNASQTAAGLGIGNYTVTVTDINGCTGTATANITQPPVLSNNVTAATYVGGWNISCNGLSDGSINQTATGGTTVYTYQWSNGQTTEDISGVAAGTYTVTVTDANGCTASTSITLTQPPVLSNNVTAATYAGGWNISCNGLSDGSINQTATGGTTVYTYQWSSGQTSEDISGVAAGTYTVTVTDANGCTASTSITLTQPPVLSNNVTAATYAGGWNISCNGLSDGSINQTATGGTTVYTYQWSSGQTSEDISSVAAGTYTVTVTDANGCTASTSITLTQPPVLSNNVTAATYVGGWNISCNGLSDGSINQTATGGTTVYTYQWSSGQTSEDISSVAAGTYTVTVTDANGCTASTSITLTQPPVLSNNVTAATYAGGWNISCNGLSDGSINQTATGGTTVYTYQWSSGQTSEDISGVAAGTYTVTVTDANGCTASTSITLTQPPVLSNNVTAATYAGGWNISCNGLSDGSINQTATGGTTVYTYQWSSGQTSEDISSVAAGTYTVTVTDANGCTASTSITLTQPPVLSNNVTAATYAGGWNISCNGLSDGSINQTATGGTTVYTYQWSSGQTSEDISSVAAGTYTVTVTDANGCTASISITLTQPPVLSNNVTAATYAGGWNISCNGLSDGSINQTATGGTTVYTYQWSSGQTSEDISGVAAGTYTVTVTDANGCTASTSITLTQPPVLSNNVTAATYAGGWNISCNGLSDGSINQTATGGTTVYTYQWSSGQTSEDISGLAAGTYTVTVTDANGCTASTSITLTQPPVLSNNVTAATYVGGWNISCNGLSDGSINQTATGGTTVYTYQWSSGQTSEDISSVAAGTYTVTVTDANGCTASTSITLTQPPVLSNNVTAATYVGGWNISCNGLSDGSINQTATGGTTVYTYQWSSGQTSEDISSVAAGTYTVTVTDANGCTASTSITLTQPPVLSNNVTAATYAGGWNISCNGLSDGSINQTATGGTTVYTYQWSSGQTSEDISGVAAGTYTVTVTDANGCTASTSITLTQPPVLSNNVTAATYAGGWNISCNGLSDGSINQTATGGTTVYTYQWSSGQTSEDISSVAAGTYTVTVTDANGCTASTSITLTEPPVLSNNVTAATYVGGWNISCNGLSDGSINQTATGGTTVYTYQWSSGQTSEDISSVAAGTYTVTVTDANGCTASTSITLTQPPVLSNNVTAATYAGGWNISCNGLSDGSINQTATGGTTVYTYQWSSGQTSEDISGVAAGTYTVTVTDANGCTASTSITLTQPPVLSNNVTAATYVGGWNISCNGLSDGSINQTATGGTTVYTYQWSSGQTSEDISGVAAGTYTVTVTDANGCTASTSITLTEPPVLTIVSGTTDADICYGLSSDVFASPNGGTGVLVISWNQGLPDGSPNTVSPTTTTVYTATVTDENGCTASASTTIIVFDLPIPIVANNGPACEGFSITLTANGGVGYSWIGPNGFASNMQNPVLNNVDVSHGGIYTVTVTSSDGCTASTTMNVVVNPLPAPNFTAVNLIGCSPVCTEFSDLSTISAGSVTGWEWSANGTIFSNQQNPTQCFETPGIYDIFMTAMSDQGCTASFIINDLITVFANPVANFSSYPEVITSEDPTVYFTNNSTANAVTWSWNFGDGAFSDLENPKHMYADTGEFCITLTVTTVNNCPSTVINCIYIYPEYQIYIPNSFTPNGDKINDFFSVGGMGYVSLEMEIFDRWGESIYFTDNNIGWPGTIGSSDIIAKQDVYVYKIWVTSNLGEKFEYYGHINLLR